MAWYQYRQNNSGGRFDGPAINVVVEADDEIQARSVAAGNGVDECADFCECCGERWWLDGPERTDDKPDLVELFGSEYMANTSTYVGRGVPRALYIHADGTKEATT